MTIKKINDALKVVGTDKLKDIIIKSEKEDIEYGLRFCKNGKITATGMCSGKSCAVELERCENKKLMGSFHTHPRGSPNDIYYTNLSEGDISDSVSNNEDFSCIGLVQKKRPIIKCYLPYYGVDNDIAIDVIKTKEDFNKKIAEYNPGRTQEGMDALQLSKSVELHKLFKKYYVARKRIEGASEEAFHKLRSEPNDGADLIVNL